MENQGVPDQTCVLKVNMQCCNACPPRLKTKLLRLEGVYSVIADREKGLVTVSGRSLNPSMFIKTIAKIGRRAEIYSFDEKKDDAIIQDCGFHSDDDSDQEDDINHNVYETESEKINGSNGKQRNHHNRHHHQNVHDTSNVGTSVNRPAGVAPLYGNGEFMSPPMGFQPLRPYGHPGYRPVMVQQWSGPAPAPGSYDYHSASPPMPWQTPPPELPPYYQLRLPPMADAPHHVLSDDNVNSCSIF